MRYFQIPEARTDLFATAGCITRLQRPERQRLLPTRICNTKERTISGLRASVHPFGPPGIWAQQLPKVNVACGLFSTGGKAESDKGGRLHVLRRLRRNLEEEVPGPKRVRLPGKYDFNAHVLRQGHS